jgi:2-keto-4-pentenoate hydratase/2-oxohepta-3-ene-1,7-dioic acid hydratase in catechol pathway
MLTSKGLIRFRGSSELIRVGKILCVGRNYESHAREMNTKVPEEPMVFLKPPTALVQDGESVMIPKISSDLHHEVEMVLLFGKRGRDIGEAEAMKYIAGYGVGLDMTLRDVQAEAKKKGLPWTVAKGFDTSAPVSEFVRAKDVPDPHCLNITLKVNGQLRQSANTRNMIFRIGDIIAFISSIFTLEPGDLIFTGTPEGVGSVVAGDQLEAELETVGKLRVSIRN